MSDLKTPGVNPKQLTRQISGQSQQGGNGQNTPPSGVGSVQEENQIGQQTGAPSNTVSNLKTPTANPKGQPRPISGQTQQGGNGQNTQLRAINGNGLGNLEQASEAGTAPGQVTTQMGPSSGQAQQGGAGANTLISGSSATANGVANPEAASQ